MRNMAAQLDPRQILQHLNSLGYCNIRAEQLQEFIKDLKLLMKYEERYSNDHHGQTEPIPNINLVVNIQKPVEKRKSIVAPLATANRDRRSANPSLSKPPLLKKLMAERDCDQIRSRPDRNSSQEKIDRIRTEILGKTTANGAKEQTDKDDAPKKRPVRKPSHKASCDQLVRNTPTELFQMYQESWNKYKKLMPGENSREDVRAVVRKKLQVKPEEKSKVYYCLKDNHKTFRRL